MISNRAKNISPALTLEISSKAKALKAEGRDIINLSIGEPDFNTPDGAKNGGINAINNNLTKYDTASGNMGLKEAIVRKFKRENNVEIQTSNVVVSNGAKQAITNVCLAVLNEGDEVLIPAPCWVSYTEIVKIAGSTPIIVRTKKENSFLVTKDELEKNISPKTRAAIITNPSNPTGAMFSREELEEICEFLTEKGILIIADEIYERFSYDEEFVSVFNLGEKIKNNAIIINGFSKTYSMTGWRVGYSVADSETTKAIGAIQSHITSHPSTISQHAAIAAIEETEEDVKIMAKAYKARKDMIADFFKSWGKLDIIPPKGAFYVFVDITPMAKDIEEGKKSMAVANLLLDNYNLAVIPGIAFEEDNFIRLSYAASDEEIKRGLDALKKAYEDNVK